MPDCQHPQCHERLITTLGKKASWEKVDALDDEIKTKMPKSWLKWWWLGFASVGVPMLAAAIGVWAGQQSDILRYANKDAVVANQIRLTRLEEFRVTIRRDIEDIKCNQAEMLKLLRRREHEKKN